MHIHQHGGNVAYYAQKLNISMSEILDYSANINPLGYPMEIKKAIIENFNTISYYPDPTYQELISIIACFEKVAGNNLILGNGAVELIYLLCHAIKPTKVLIPVPTFSEYARAAESCGAKVDYLPMDAEDNFSLPLENIISRLSDYQVLFICNPNNPTGNLYSSDNLIYLAEKCKAKEVFLVIDESFMDFVVSGNESGMSSYVKTNPYLVVLKSLTKILGIPGLRIGYGVCHTQIIDILSRAKDPWNINCFAEIAVKEALKESSFIEKTRQLVKVEKQFMYEQLSSIPGLMPFSSAVNYLLVKITNNTLTSTELAKDTAAKGILIRDCSNFPGLSNQYFRLAVKVREKNLVLLTKLKAIITGRDG